MNLFLWIYSQKSAKILIGIAVVVLIGASMLSLYHTSSMKPIISTAIFLVVLMFWIKQPGTRNRRKSIRIFSWIVIVILSFPGIFFSTVISVNGYKELNHVFSHIRFLATTPELSEMRNPIQNTLLVIMDDEWYYQNAAVPPAENNEVDTSREQYTRLVESLLNVYKTDRLFLDFGVCIPTHNPEGDQVLYDWLESTDQQTVVMVVGDKKGLDGIEYPEAMICMENAEFWNSINSNDNVVPGNVLIFLSVFGVPRRSSLTDVLQGKTVENPTIREEFSPLFPEFNKENIWKTLPNQGLGIDVVKASEVSSLKQGQGYYDLVLVGFPEKRDIHPTYVGPTNGSSIILQSLLERK